MMGDWHVLREKSSISSGRVNTVVNPQPNKTIGALGNDYSEPREAGLPAHQTFSPSENVYP